MDDDVLSLSREALRKLSKSELVELGKQLRAIREETGLSQRSIQAAVGIKGGNLSKFELGKERPSLAAIDLYRQLKERVQLDDLRWNRSRKPPKPKNVGFPVVLSEEITIFVNENGIARHIERQLHMRAGRIEVPGLFLGEDYEEAHRFRVVNGGRLSVFQEGEDGDSFGFGVAFFAPLQQNEEHFVHLTLKPDESLRAHLLQRLPWHDVRRLIVKLWAPPESFDGFVVERIDGLMPGSKIDPSIVQEIKPTTNGLFRTEFRTMLETWSYGIRWHSG